MKFFVYSFMNIILLLNIRFNNSLPPGIEVYKCYREIMQNLSNFSTATDCFQYFTYYPEPEKPELPIVESASEDLDLDNTLINLTHWAKYVFYLGERVVFKNGILRPTRYCRTKYIKNEIAATINMNGDLVYKREYLNRRSRVLHLANEVIRFEEYENPDDEFVHDNMSKALKDHRQNCLTKLQNANLNDGMSDKELFDNLYRLNGIHCKENKSIEGGYHKHIIRKTILLDGTHDPLPFCQKCSVLAALNDNTDASTSNNPTLDLINQLENYNDDNDDENNAEINRSGSPPELLYLFPTQG